MHKLKKISRGSIPRAIAKAERYRLLNEPRAAESICRDVLAIDPDNQDATANLLLAITDQFTLGHTRLAEAEEIIPRLADEHSRQYYTGVMLERWAKALLAGRGHRLAAAEHFAAAMAAYERAEAIAPDANEDAILRWNTCARIIERSGLEAGAEGADVDAEIEGFDDEVPRR
jgi:tetratricopeptide (TPR) repeat protein